MQDRTAFVLDWISGRN
jgi:hypothetical protein